MEVKKSKEANIDDSRSSIVVVGVLFVSSLVLASFSYKAPVDLGGDVISVARTQDATIQAEEPDTPPPPPDTPPQMDVPPPPQEEVIEKKNEEKPPVAVVTPPPPPVIKGPTETKVEKEIIDFPEVEAQFPGGNAAMQAWISKNVNYPQTSIEMNEQGRVYLSFVVEPDGSITNVVVVKSVSGDLDREAKRLIKAMPKWTPGEAAGERARTRCQIPINFTLN